MAGAARSASRSTQKTYSQARSRLGRDSSLLMFRPCSAKTRSAARSVPGSFRTVMTSVVPHGGRPPRPASAGRSAAPGGASTRNRVRLPGRSPDLVDQDLEAEQRRRPRREDGGRAALAAIGDGLAGPGRVVGREQLPRPGPQERLGLAERLDVRVDPLDVVEPLAGQRSEAQPDRDDDLAADHEVVLEQQVVVLADGAVDDVLDRDDAGARRHRRRPPRRRRGTPPSGTRAGVVPEVRQDGVLGEGAGLAGVGDRSVVAHRAESSGRVPRRTARCGTVPPCHRPAARCPSGT